MLKPGTEAIVNRYCENEPAIAAIHKSLMQAVVVLAETFQRGGKLLVCGNGGSCADADHIVGELVKAFRIERPLDSSFAASLERLGADGKLLAQKLQGGLPAINLGSHTALMTAMDNDVGSEYVFAQQVAAYGQAEDVFLGISTSGNSRNVLLAGKTAKAKGLKTLALTGRTGGEMAEEFDLILCADAGCTEDVQDLHSELYHAVCAAVEYELWGD